MEVKDQIQFADIPEVLIQNIHKLLDNLQYDEFVFVFVNNCYEVQ